MASAQAATAKAIPIGIIIEPSMMIIKSIHNFPKKPEYVQNSLSILQPLFISICRVPVSTQAIMIETTRMIGSKNM